MPTQETKISGNEQFVKDAIIREAGSVKAQDNERNSQLHLSSSNQISDIVQQYRKTSENAYSGSAPHRGDTGNNGSEISQDEELGEVDGNSGVISIYPWISSDGSCQIPSKKEESSVHSNQIEEKRDEHDTAVELDKKCSFPPVDEAWATFPNTNLPVLQQGVDNGQEMSKFSSFLMCGTETDDSEASIDSVITSKTVNLSGRLLLSPKLVKNERGGIISSTANLFWKSETRLNFHNHSCVSGSCGICKPSRKGAQRGDLAS